MVTLANHVIARARFTLRGAPSTLEILRHLPAKYRRRPKKVSTSERGVPLVTIGGGHQGIL